jgi:hypothetical protein
VQLKALSGLEQKDKKLSLKLNKLQQVPQKENVGIRCEETASN